MPQAVRLFGEAQADLGGEWVPLPRDKRGALLAYLAIDGGQVSRERLAFLLWPDSTDAVARRNLRQLLSRLKRHPLGSSVECSRTHLHWDVTTDLAAFKAALTRGAVADAFDSCRQELCVGLDLDEAEGWTGWLAQVREEVRTEWRRAATALTRQLQAEGQAADAARVLQAVWHADLLDDEALHDYLLAARAAGLKDEALTAFRAYEKLLDGELGVAPLPETRALVAALESTGTPVETGLHGRERELAELRAHLRDPSCRLLSLTGEGGVGKTRLAQELMNADLPGRFADGRWFVTLGHVVDASQVVAEIARAAGFGFAGGSSPEAQLLDHVRDLSALLVLDDVEHLMAAMDTVARLLEAAPAVTVVVTSRHAPELPGGVVVRLGGLDAPEEPVTDLAGIASSAAGGMLIARGAAANRRWRPSSDDATHLARICALTGGLPLALELAGAMFAVLEPSEVADELEADVAALDRSPAVTADADPAAEHAPGPGPTSAMRAVFERSWRLLAPEQRDALASLAVFAGGFSRSAAQAALGVNLAVLLGLVARSLLAKQGSGRYVLHPLLRRFALEKLAASGLEDRVREAHAHHFLGALAEAGRPEADHGSSVLADLDQDLGNVAAAWSSAVLNRDLPRMSGALRGLTLLLERRSAFALGTDLLAGAADVLPAGSELRAQVQSHVGGLLCRLARFEEAERLTGGALAVLRGAAGAGYAPALNRHAASLDGLGRYAEAREEYGIALHYAETWGETDAQLAAITGLGLVAMHLGDLAEAESRFTAAIEAARELGRARQLVTLLQDLALTQLRRGRHAEGLGTAEAGLAAAREAGDVHATAEALTAKGIALYGLGENEPARAAFEESLLLHRRIGNRARVAGALNNLAGVAHALGDLGAATRLTQESLAIAKEMGDVKAVALRSHNLGNFYQYAGDLAAALRCFEEALDSGQRLGHRREVAATLASIGSCLVEAGRGEEAAAKLSESFALALEVGAHDVATTALVSLASLRLDDAPESAVVAASAVLSHPSSLPAARRASEELVADGETRLGKARVRSLSENAAGTELELIASRLVADVRTTSDEA